MMKVYSNVAVVVSAYLCVVLGETSSRFRARFNVKLKEHQVDKSVTTDSLMMCMALCKAEKSFMCEAASWGEETCLLSKKVRIHERTDDLNTNENWITMCRIVYRVFMAEGDGGRYSLTFGEANARCERSGSSIATREDLLQARAIGFEFCACGWLADGTGGMVLQEPNYDCWRKWSEDIVGGCTINFSKLNVYCKV